MTTDAQETCKQRFEKEGRHLKLSLSSFVMHDHGDFMAAAWDDFFCYQANLPDYFEDKDLFFGAFWHFYCFNWIPTPEEGSPPSTIKFPLALEYLSQHRDELSDDAIEYIHACLKTRYSIYEVRSIQPGIGATIRNLLNDEEFWMEDESAGEFLYEKYMIMASILRHENLNLCLGIHPQLVPTSYRQKVISFRQEQLNGPSSEVTLVQRDYMMRDLFYTLVDHCNQKEESVFIDISFDLHCSMEQAVELLVTLSDGLFDKEEVAEMPQNQLVDPSVALMIPWLDRNGETDGSFRLRGFLNVSPGALEVVFDSIEGAAQTRATIEELFGPMATYVSTNVDVSSQH